MTMKRKHHVIVEITFDEPVPMKTATVLVKRIMSNSYSEIGFYGRTYKIKSFARVVTALKFKWIAKALRNYHGTSVRDTLYLMRSS